MAATETRRCVAPGEDNVAFGDFPPRWAAPGVSGQRLNSKSLFFKKLFCYHAFRRLCATIGIQARPGRHGLDRTKLNHGATPTTD